MMRTEYNVLLCEAALAVESIDIMAFESAGDLADIEPISELITDGHVIIVKFLGIHVWNTDDDDRIYDEATNTWEPLEPFLIKRINETILPKIRAIELYVR